MQILGSTLLLSGGVVVYGKATSANRKANSVERSSTVEQVKTRKCSLPLIPSLLCTTSSSVSS